MPAKRIAEGTTLDAKFNRRGVRKLVGSFKHISTRASALKVSVTYGLNSVRLASGSSTPDQDLRAVTRCLQEFAASRNGSPVVTAPAVPFSLPALGTLLVSCPMEYCSATSRPLMLLPVLMVFKFSIVQAARGSVDQCRIAAVLAHDSQLRESRLMVKCTGPLSLVDVWLIRASASLSCQHLLHAWVAVNRPRPSQTMTAWNFCGPGWQIGISAISEADFAVNSRGAAAEIKRGSVLQTQHWPRGTSPCGRNRVLRWRGLRRRGRSPLKRRPSGLWLRG